MLKNKKAQNTGIFAGIMIAITLLIVVIQLVTPIKDQINDARSPTNLDCTNSSITTMQKATCVVLDTTLFYFVGMALAGALGFVGFKFIKGDFRGG